MKWEVILDNDTDGVYIARSGKYVITAIERSDGYYTEVYYTLYKSNHEHFYWFDQDFDHINEDSIVSFIKRCEEYIASGDHNE